MLTARAATSKTAATEIVASRPIRSWPQRVSSRRLRPPTRPARQTNEHGVGLLEPRQKARRSCERASAARPAGTVASSTRSNTSSSASGRLTKSSSVAVASATVGLRGIEGAAEAGGGRALGGHEQMFAS
jgi:hypothetical protein